MLAVISPAKTLDYESPCPAHRPTTASFLDDADELITVLRRKSKAELRELMDISPALAELNHARYREWALPFSEDSARAAIFAFKGDVYTGFDLANYTKSDLQFAQKHLRILSGLYGVLRPLDLMLPYRLEMGTALKTKRGKNLYEFWGDRISENLNAALGKSGKNTLVNLASQEYFASVRPEQIRARIVTPVFKEWKSDRYRIVSFFAKKARGLMCDYLVRHRLEDPEDLKSFDSEGYRHHPDGSDANTWLFVRGDT